MQADININAMYKDVFTLGVLMRTNDAVTIMAELQSSPRLRIGYAYDVTISKLNNYTSGTHEIMIGFNFGKDIIKMKTPRFF